MLKKDKKRSPRLALLCGILAAVAVTLTVFVVCAGVMTFVGGLSDGTVNTVVYITSLVSVFFGSFLTAVGIEKRGLLNGMLLGLIYTLAMVFCGYIVLPGFSLGIKTLITLAVSLLSGAAGGAFGINAGR